MRKSTAGILIAALSLVTLGTLSACAPSSAAACTDGLPASDTARSVAASGDLDTIPTTAAFPTPLVASTVSAAAITTGDGAVVQPGDTVSASVTIFDGATGSAINGGTIMIPNDAADLPMLAGTACHTVGSRVAVVGPAKALIGDYASNFGVQDDATLVMTLDIDADYLGRATGDRLAPENGFPNVSLLDDGRPGVSFTGAAAPGELKTETLVKGDGAVVQDGDDVVVQYTGIDWDTKKVFDTTWDSGRPAVLSTSSVVPGFKQALVGATVGSQVVAIVPPAEGYGDNPPSSSGLTSTSTMLFVIDVLGIAPAGTAAASN